jgi:hypothetical protein
MKHCSDSPSPPACCWPPAAHLPPTTHQLASGNRSTMHGKPKSIIEITDNNGELQGKVLQVMNLSPGRHRSEGRRIRSACAMRMAPARISRSKA